MLAVVNPLLGGSKAAELMPKDYHLAGNVENGSFMVTSEKPLGAGRINLGGHNTAAFAAIEIKGRKYVFLSLDLSRQTPAEREQALGYVNNFVASQDDPVIIFGDFGIPAWAPAFGRFSGQQRAGSQKRLVLPAAERHFSADLVYNRLPQSGV